MILLNENTKSYLQNSVSKDLNIDLKVFLKESFEITKDKNNLIDNNSFEDRCRWYIGKMCHTPVIQKEIFDYIKSSIEIYSIDFGTNNNIIIKEKNIELKDNNRIFVMTLFFTLFSFNKALAIKDDSSIFSNSKFPLVKYDNLIIKAQTEMFIKELFRLVNLSIYNFDVEIFHNLYNYLIQNSESIAVLLSVIVMILLIDEIYSDTNTAILMISQRIPYCLRETLSDYISSFIGVTGDFLNLKVEYLISEIRKNLNNPKNEEIKKIIDKDIIVNKPPINNDTNKLPRQLLVDKIKKG